MVDMYQVLLGMLAVAIMICVPILAVVAYDLMAGRWDAKIQRWRDLHRLGHSGAPIEDIARDLRRLRACVEEDANRSATHQLADRIAYDLVLAEACAMLEIPHELDTEIAALDRELERFRIEAALQDAGVVLTNRRHGQPH